MKRSVSIARNDHDVEGEDLLGHPSISAPSFQDFKRPSVEQRMDSNNGAIDGTSALDRFATLKEKLKLVR